uniref:PPUP7567 n=1 Tax=Poeciliopsis prolifica TaxID=188132 RepID=A0A0S7ESC7_9TELE
MFDKKTAISALQFKNQSGVVTGSAGPSGDQTGSEVPNRALKPLFKWAQNRGFREAASVLGHLVKVCFVSGDPTLKLVVERINQGNIKLSSVPFKKTIGYY